MQFTCILIISHDIKVQAHSQPFSFWGGRFTRKGILTQNKLVGPRRLKCNLPVAYFWTKCGPPASWGGGVLWPLLATGLISIAGYWSHQAEGNWIFCFPRNSYWDWLLLTNWLLLVIVAVCIQAQYHLPKTVPSRLEIQQRWRELQFYNTQ